MNRLCRLSVTLSTLAASTLALSGMATGQCAASKGESAESPGTVKTASYVTEVKETKDIVDTALAAGKFNTLAAALKAAGLVDVLKGKGPFTVFAPTDEAFAKLPKGTVESLLKPENKEKLAAILTYHVVSGEATADKVVKMTSATTVNGQRVDISVKDGKVWLDQLAQVTTTDIACSNGVIHVIDSVIMPSDKTIIQTAGEVGSFKTLLAAIDAAGLKSALEGTGPFTVMAPTDEAFAKLPPGTVENLLKPENKDKLAAILKFHVLPGRVYADQVVTMKESVKTLQGSTFMIKVQDGKVWIGNDKAMANVVTPDVEASNGVVHVIDTVIMPK
ncbi:MAG TPA: fasciclin domain-containing protein [Phycisphaerales bacterium]|nr:fasciclin domain-containing protein [Phycisphaerales bacterium]